MNITPARLTVICKPLTMTGDSGLSMAVSNDRMKPEIAEIVKIGKGIKPVPMEVGQTIVFKKFMDYKITIDGEAYIFVEFKDILGIY